MVNQRNEPEYTALANRTNLKKWKSKFRSELELLFLTRCYKGGFILPTFTRKHVPIEYSAMWQSDKIKKIQTILASKKHRAEFSYENWLRLPSKIRSQLKSYKYERKVTFVVFLCFGDF